MEAGEPQKGLDVLSRAQPGERGERIADLQFNLATAHEALGEQTQAARHYLQAAQLYRSQGAAAAEGDTCVRLARCHLQRKVRDSAAHTDPNVTANNDVNLHAEFCIYLILCVASEVKQVCVLQEWDEAAASFRRAAESYKTAGNTPAAALALKDAGKHMLQSGRNATDDIISVLTDSLEMSANISDQETLGNTNEE